MHRRAAWQAVVALVLSGVATAEAHTGVGVTHALDAGLTHPLMGIDHLLATIAIGLWASHLGGRERWSIPSTFLLCLVLGAGLALAGAGLPLVEFGLVSSIVLLGLLLVTDLRVSTMAAMTAVGLLALYRGFAHGAEAALDSGAAAYGTGFLVSTMLLLGVGALGGSMMQRLTNALVPRYAGAALAILGTLAALS